MLAEAVEPTQADPWYTLRVKSRREKVVATSLAGKGYPQFLPLYRVSAQRRNAHCDLPMFPGYIFVRLDFQQRLPVLKIPGVVNVVGGLPVEEAEIDAIQAVVKSGMPAIPWAFTKVGQSVVIDKGPLRGVEGIFTQEKGQSRIVLSISLLQRSVSVEVDREVIRPIRKRK